jgi:hypothetical protein
MASLGYELYNDDFFGNKLKTTNCNTIVWTHLSHSILPSLAQFDFAKNKTDKTTPPKHF